MSAWHSPACGTFDITYSCKRCLSYHPAPTLCAKPENVPFRRKRKCFHLKLFLSREILAKHIFDIHLGGNFFFIIPESELRLCGGADERSPGNTEGTQVSLCPPARRSSLQLATLAFLLSGWKHFFKNCFKHGAKNRKKYKCKLKRLSSLLPSFYYLFKLLLS